MSGKFEIARSDSISTFDLASLKGEQAKISHRLIRLGYEENQIKILMSKFTVTSLEQAVDFLNIDANGWSHPFIKNTKPPESCILCGQETDYHQH